MEFWREDFCARHRFDYKKVSRWMSQGIGHPKTDSLRQLERLCERIEVKLDDLTHEDSKIDVSAAFGTQQLRKLDEVRESLMKLVTSGKLKAAVDQPQAPASGSDGVEIDNAVLSRINDRIRAANQELALGEILSGRKADPEKGIRAFPKLLDPTARWHTNKVSTRVKSRMGPNVSQVEAIDLVLDEFLKTDGWAGWD
jgi:hypothetical protein